MISVGGDDCKSSCMFVERRPDLAAAFPWFPREEACLQQRWLVLLPLAFLGTFEPETVLVLFAKA